MITIKEFAESLKAEIVAIRQIRNPHSLKLLILFHKTAVQVTQRQLQIVTGGESDGTRCFGVSGRKTECTDS